MFEPRRFVATLPHLPGVYRMIDAAGEIIYVGKARDLKKRVGSYFLRSKLFPRTELMVSQVANVEITVTHSESEALLLENNLIKAHSPRFNILFRDDKSYPYIVLSGHRFPRLAYYRGGLVKGNRHFGPYPNAWAVKESIQLLQRIFRLRTCEDSVFDNRSRPCLLYQIKRCSGPCVSMVSDDDYAETVRDATLFLNGRNNELISRLSKAMEAAADEQRYEDAAVLRDQVFSLHRVQEKQFVEQDRPVDADMVACVAHQGMLCVNVVMIRGGRHLGDRSYFPDNAEGWQEAEALSAFIEQHYAGQPTPPLILTQVEVDPEVAAAYPAVRFAVGTGPAWRGWLDMALANARMGIERRLAQRATAETRLAAVAETLDLPGLKRIECFDVSHTMGEATQASCVVFDDGRMQPGQYRRYNIEGLTPGDDYGAMRQALQRRYRRAVNEQTVLPDLLLIDGGKGQLHVAEEVLAELGLEGMPLAAVAKGEERKPGKEEIYFPHREEPLTIPADSPALHLIQQVRDEAHRFAITGHRARRGKARTTSSLEDIPGVGAKRRQRLLASLGGLRGVLNASIDELARVEGIGPRLAESIHRQLHQG